MVEELRRRLRGEPRERARLEGPRPYRPHRIEGKVDWRDVRELSLDEAVRRARRYGHFVAMALVVLVVAVWFPGDLPIARQLVPSGGFGAPAELDQDDAAAEVLGRQASVPGSSSVGLGSASLAGDAFGFDLGGFDGGTTGGGTTGDDDGGPGGPGGDEDAAACAFDEQLPAAVVGPTLEQAQAAQTALVGAIGQPFPVNVVDLAGPLCDAGASGYGVDEVLTLGRLVPLEDSTLLLAIDPVIRPWCPPVTHLAVAEALATQSVSPALVRGLALCVAASEASPPSPSGAGTEDLPNPTTPDTPEPTVPDEPPDTPLRPVWQSGTPIG